MRKNLIFLILSIGVRLLTLNSGDFLLDFLLNLLNLKLISFQSRVAFGGDHYLQNMYYFDWLNALVDDSFERKPGDTNSKFDIGK